MSLQSVSAALQGGGVGGNDAIPAALVELQGLRQTLVVGATANTKMDIAAIRTEDTIIGAVAFPHASGEPVNQLANITIVDTHATGTVTVAAVNADDTVTVNGNVYTFKAAPASALHVKRTAGDNTANAAALAAAINAYENRYTGSTTNAAAVVAVAASAVVTITAKVDGAAGNSITLASSNGTRLAVTGSGTLTGGSDTGGIKCSANLSANSLMVTWFNKR